MHIYITRGHRQWGGEGLRVEGDRSGLEEINGGGWRVGKRRNNVILSIINTLIIIIKII